MRRSGGLDMTECRGALAAMKKNAPKVQYNVAPLPAYKKINTLLFWTQVYVTNSSKHPKEAWDFIMFMAGGPKLMELEKLMYDVVGWMPPRNDVLKRHPNIYKDVPQYRYFAEVPGNYELYPYPRLGVTDEAFTKLAERLVKAYQDRGLVDNPSGVARVIHEAAQETNEILKENKLYCGRPAPAGAGPDGLRVPLPPAQGVRAARGSIVP